MNRYKHLSLEERERIYALKERCVSITDIADELGRNKSTISRELTRHTKHGKEYIPCHGQRETERTSARQRRKAPLKKPLIFLYVREHLREPFNWSPETIAGRLPIDHPGEGICIETIYRYIYNKDTKREKLWKHLVHHRKKRMKKNGRKVRGYTRLSEAKPIQERPKEVEERKEPGHWETDNMEGRKSDKTSVSVTVERKTRKVRIGKLSTHNAKVKTDKVVEQLSSEDEDFVRSMTMDRGPENSDYKRMSRKLNADIYACTPYHSWEKGSVENMIGRIRRYVPKGQSVDVIDQKFLTELEDKFNNTPRKCLGFLTPNEYCRKILPATVP